MTCQVLIQKDKAIILPKQLLKFLKAVPGDKLDFEFFKNGEVKVKKVQNFSSFLDEINRQMKEGRYFEKAGLKNEEDVAEFIRKLRNKKVFLDQVQ